MRRRRSPKVVWLPQDNFFSIDAATSDQNTWMRATETIGGQIGTTQSIIAPVVKDDPANVSLATTSLADLYASGYRLRRIVGKLFVECATRPSDDGEPLVFGCTAGFIILRCDVQGNPLSLATNPESYNASIIENTESPWIWRRSWYLDNRPDPHIVLPGVGQPSPRPANYNVGGNADGPHIDQKTARVVGPDERLFLVMTTTVLEQGGDPQVTAQLNWTWEVRILGSLRSNIGNRRNASR